MTSPEHSELAIAVDVSKNEADWHLRLYVAGQLPKSSVALDNLQKLCEEHLAGHYEIEVVDLVLNPTLARRDDIVAVPTLVRRLPMPLRKIIGDLANTERVLHHLQLSDPPPIAPDASDTSGTRSELVADDGRCHYELTLVVGGTTDLTVSAIANAQRLCDDYIGADCRLSVVDLHEEPASVGNHVVVTPTLIRRWPLPVRKFAGDLSKPDEVRTALGLS